jgi:multisubunit Na+/H+ antiporter MnhE subunit
MLSADLSQYMAGAALNLVIALFIVRFVYYPVTQDKRYVLTFVVFSTITYFVLGLLTSVDLSIGVGFGLFAIFSILRYRTDEMPPREMTYLFVFIALPIMNSVLMSDGEVAKLLASNAFVIVVLFVLEKGWGFKFEESKRVIYDRVELVTPGRREELLADLKARTGLAITAIEVRRLDLLRDVAELKISYTD